MSSFSPFSLVKPIIVIEPSLKNSNSERKEFPMVVLNAEIEFETDYRIAYLFTLGEFEIHRDIDHKYIRSQLRDSFFKKIKNKVFVKCKDSYISFE